MHKQQSTKILPPIKMVAEKRNQKETKFHHLIEKNTNNSSKLILLILGSEYWFQKTHFFNLVQENWRLWSILKISLQIYFEHRHFLKHCIENWKNEF